MTSPTARPPVAFAILGGLGAGACVAAQGRVNADLASAGAGVLAASWYSYLGTLLTLVIVAALAGRLARIVRTIRAHARWWWFAIGCCGVPIVMAMVVGVPLVGVALAAVCSLAGQTVAGMVLDSRGVGVPSAIAFTARRAIAALAAVGGLAVVLIAAPAPSGTPAGVIAAAALALFVAGFILSGQQAGNGAVMGVTRDALIPTLTSCAGGFVLITLILGGAWGAGTLGPIHFPGPGQWWLYLGGPLGTAITALSAYAVRHLGTLVLTFVIVGGQLATAVVIDLAVGVPTSWATAIAIAAIAIAVGLSAGRRPARLTRPPGAA